MKVLRPLGGVPSSNTMDPQSLMAELKMVNKGHGVVIPKNATSQPQLQQVRIKVSQPSSRFASNLAKAGGSSRKHSRGQQAQASNFGPVQKVKLKSTTHVSKAAQRTPVHPASFARDGQNQLSSGVLPRPDVILHPHPLNDKRHAGQLSDKSTPQLRRRVVDRPPSQKVTSQINNRNSRKAFRPLAKKVNLGGGSRDKNLAVGDPKLYRTNSGEAAFTIGHSNL